MMNKKHFKYISLIIITIIAVFSTSIVKAEDESDYDQTKYCYRCQVGKRYFAKLLTRQEAESGEFCDGKVYQINQDNCEDMDLATETNKKCAVCRVDDQKSGDKFYRYIREGYDRKNCSTINPGNDGLTACDKSEVGYSEKSSNSKSGSKSVKRSEDEIGGKLRNEPTITPNSSSSQNQIINSSKKVINGTVCTEYNVCKDHKLPTRQYFANQGNLVYAVKPLETCNTNNQYVAFCLDPDMDGVYDDCPNGVQYHANPLDATNAFNQMLYELYKIYPKGATDDETYFTYTGAARILEFMPYAKDSFVSQRGTVLGRINSHIGVWQNAANGDCSGIGGAGIKACSLATTAYNNWLNISGGDPKKYEESVLNDTLGLSIASGAFTYSGNSYNGTYNIVIENYTGKPKANEIVNGLSVEFDGGSATIEKDNYTIDSDHQKIYVPVKISGTYSNEDCSNKILKAILNYNSSNGGDIRDAMIIVGTDKNAYQKQRFALFTNSGGNEVKIENQTTISFGDCGTEEGCSPSGELICGPEESNFTVINEGDSNHDGVTEWESCIIGKTDPKGNSYDVVNTTNDKNQTTVDDQDKIDETEENRNQILAYVSYGNHKITDANYCIISCKEKYAFLLPGGEKNVKQGTYFSFHVDRRYDHNAAVGISAERLCVSNSIDNSEFKNRIIDLRKQQVDYLNMYMYYKQLYNALYSAQNAHLYLQNAKSDPKFEPPLSNNGDSHCYGNQKWKDENGYGIHANGEKASMEKAILNYTPQGSKYQLKNLKWLKAITADEAKYVIGSKGLKYYKLNNPEDPNGGFDEITVNNVDLSKSFIEFIESHDGLNIKDKNFYQTYYKSKYSTDIWNTKTIVDEYYNPFEVSVNDNADSKYSGGCPTCDPPTGDSCNTPKDYDEKVEVKYLEKWDDKYLTSTEDISKIDIYKKYMEMLKRLKTAYEAALSKYQAINKQIGLQADGIQLCTNYTMNDLSKNSFNFDPIISFSYPDQDNYMEMLKPGILENMNEGEVDVQYNTYYCKDKKDDANEVFKCPNEIGSTEFEFENVISDDDKEGKWNSGNADALFVMPSKYGKNNRDKVKFYDASQVGSRAQYGRFSENNENCSDRSKFVAGTGSASDYCYEFYQSAKQFYRLHPDGLVTTNKDAEYAEILDHDGRVYPVTIQTKEGPYPYYITFTNIGQYNESGNLGRLMGGGTKEPVLSGHLENIEVCNYEVCRIDDPNCGDDYCLTDDGERKSIKECLMDTSKTKADCEKEVCNNSENSCSTIINGKICNYGNLRKPSDFSDSNYVKCIKALLDSNCCSEASGFRGNVIGFVNNREGTFANGFLPADMVDDYLNKCSGKSYCTSFSINPYNTSIDSQYSDSVKLVDDGSLQMNARTISLSNPFPNGVSVNWNANKEARDVITEITQKGESAYEGDPEYSIIMNTRCGNNVKEYNNKQNSNSDDSTLSNGGYNDYTNVVLDSYNKDDGKNVKTKGRTVVMSEEFQKVLIDNCQYSGRFASTSASDPIAPDPIKDSSEVKS